MTREEYMEGIAKLSTRELKRELSDIYDRLCSKEDENEQLKALMSRVMNAAQGEEERIELRKKANQALSDALAKADDIIKEARETADRIINHAHAIRELAEKGEDISEFVLPGSKDLIISDDLLKPQPQKHSFDEYFVKPPKEEAGQPKVESWRDMVDNLRK